jgi:hypothetical protein
MNERIIQLALDAGLLNYIDNETPRQYFVSGVACKEQVEEFAQLLVKECANIVNSLSQHEGSGDSYIAEYIKDCFGV